MLRRTAAVKFIYTATRAVLGGLFMYAGVMKLMHLDQFADSLDAYSIFPDPFVYPISFLVPAMEVLTGVALLVDILGALALYGIIIISFSGVLAYAISIGLDMDCGCFGPGDDPLALPGGLTRALYRNFAILIAILFLYFLRGRYRFRPVSLKGVFMKLIRMF